MTNIAGHENSGCSTASPAGSQRRERRSPPTGRHFSSARPRLCRTVDGDTTAEVSTPASLDAARAGGRPSDDSSPRECRGESAKSELVFDRVAARPTKSLPGRRAASAKCCARPDPVSEGSDREGQDHEQGWPMKASDGARFVSETEKWDSPRPLVLSRHGGRRASGPTTLESAERGRG